MTARAASPAVINSSDALGSKVRGLWLVDATGSIPDLKANESSLAKTGGSNPAYSSGGLLGGQLTGNATDIATASLGTPLSVWGWTMGCVAVYTAASVSGFQMVFGFGNATTDSGGSFTCIGIDDGTFGAANKWVALFRSQDSGTVGQITGPTCTQNLLTALIFQIDAPDANTGRFVVNGSSFTSFANFPESSITNAWSNAAFLGANRGGGHSFGVASSNAQVALGLLALSGVGVNSTIMTNWTNDPWTIIQASGGGGFKPLWAAGSNVVLSSGARGE